MVQRMKTLTKYLNEKLVINKDYKDAYTCAPNTVEELRKIIEDRYNEFGPGTKNNPIDFNDVDVSNIDSFYDNNINIGIFEDIKFEYIDISDWNVSNVKKMVSMFYKCKQLKSIGDISDWNVSNVKDTTAMFFGCEQLKSVGDLSNWDVSNVKYMNNTFKESGITNIPKWYKG